MGTSLRADRHFGSQKDGVPHARPAAQPAFSPVRGRVRGLIFVLHHCSIRTTFIVAVPWAWVILESSLCFFTLCFFGLCAFDPYG